MRRRSQTIQADTYEEFLELSIIQGPDMTPNTSSIPQSPYCYQLSPPRDTQKYNQAFYEACDNCFDDTAGQISLLDRFTDIEDPFDGTMTPSTDFTGATSRTCSAGSTSECDGWLPFIKEMAKVEKPKIYQVMIVGGNGVGKHCLIDSVFGEEAKEGMKPSGSFDLVIKHQEQEGYTNTFKFWIRDPTNEKIEPLIKVYYKMINLYIFVYRVDDRESFECLDKVIEKVKAEVSDERFRGILISNVSNVCNRNVCYEEGLRLKQKHRLSQFVEIKYSSSALEKVMFDFLYSKDKKN